MLFLSQVLASVVLAVVTARRPAVGLAVVLAVAAGLPFGAAQLVLGTTWHPAVTIALAMVLVCALRNPRAVGTVLAARPLVTAALVTFLVVAVVTSWSTGRAGDLGTLVMQIVAPVAVFVVVSTATAEGLLRPGTVARTFVAVCVGAALILIAVWAGIVTQPWQSEVESSRWWSVEPDRMTGTFDHPLVASLWLSAAVPLACDLRSAWVRVSVVLTLLFAIALTGSRLALVVAGVAAVVVLLRSRVHAMTKATVVILLTTATAWFLQSSAADLVNERFADDGGSSSARLQSLRLAADVWSETIVFGRGFGASEQVTRNALISTTFENPVVMFSIDFGVVATLLFFGALVGILVRTSRETTVAGARLGAVLVLVSILGFNSLSTNTPIGLVVFLLLALAGAPRPAAGRPEPSPGTRPSAHGVLA